jgi:aminoglycoside phosphotransferase (APT) family kinase protein
MSEDDAVTRPALGDEIAITLASLHAIALDRLPDGLLPEMDPESYLETLLRDAGAYLRARLSAAQTASLKALCDESRDVLPGHERTLCHGDPWFENMLLNEDGGLTALLDFQDACIADPVLDLSAQTYLTPPSAARVIEAYVDRTGPQRNLTSRLRGYLLLRELGGLAYALRNDLAGEIEHAMGDVIGVLEA